MAAYLRQTFMKNFSSPKSARLLIAAFLFLAVVAAAASVSMLRQIHKLDAKIDKFSNVEFQFWSVGKRLESLENGLASLQSGSFNHEQSLSYIRSDIEDIQWSVSVLCDELVSSGRRFDC